jgi:uncharacterized protein YegL
MPPCTVHGEDNCVRCAVGEDLEVIVPKVHVSIVLDRSGSMAPSAAQTIGGFNEYVKGLKAQADTEYTVSLTTFDHTVTPVFVDRPIKDVPELTGDTYRAGGGTALYDAIGQVLGDVEAAAEKDLTIGHMVVIITDGEDESSRIVSKKQAIDLIAGAEKKAVTLAYMGANPDAFKGGERLFAASGNATASSNVIGASGQHAYASLTHATTMYSSSRSATMSAARTVSANTGWDFEKSLASVSGSVGGLFTDTGETTSVEPAKTPEKP